MQEQEHNHHRQHRALDDGTLDVVELRLYAHRLVVDDGQLDVGRQGFAQFGGGLLDAFADLHPAWKIHDAYETYGKLLAENAPVVILGTVMKGNDGARLNVKELYPLDAYLQNNIRKVTWLVAPQHPELPVFLQQLRAAIDAANGDTRVELAFLFDDRVAPIAETSTALKWRIMPDAFQRLRAHPACAGLLAEARTPELKEVKRWGKKF